MLSIRRSLLRPVAALLALGALAGGNVGVAAASWSSPAHIPGTGGLANPVSATAPDGTRVVIWTEGTGVGTQNAVHALVRRAGQARWQDVPVRLKASFLQGIVTVPTPAGDLWIAYQTGINGEVFVSKLDASALHWSKPSRVFHQTGYAHAGPLIGRAGDGTLVVAAYAPPISPPAGDPVYRTVVATRRPGGSWAQWFLSPVDKHSGPGGLAVNEAGDIVVASIEGYNLADMTVVAATRSHAAGAKWKIRPLSDAGDSQGRLGVAIGRDGTAPVAWPATSTSFAAIRMATIDVRLPLDPWVGRDVTTGTPSASGPHVVVAPDGQVDVAWTRYTGGEQVVWSRHLSGNTLSPAVQLSPNGRITALASMLLRPDGKTALLYHVFSPSIVSEGLRFRVLVGGVPGPEVVLTGSLDIDGAANGESLTVDGRSRGTVIYTRGDYPDTDFVWLSQAP